MGNLFGQRSQSPGEGTEDEVFGEYQEGFCFDIHQMIKIKANPIANQYVIITPAIGKGAFGEVFQAYHKFTKLIRSVKKVQTRHSAGTLEEYEVLRDLDHPNILKLYEIFIEGPFYFLVTDYYQGGSLREKIQDSQRMNEFLSAKYMEQILMALAYMNTKGFMHCDLKPDNILLDRTHKLVKIIDFGMSRRINDKNCKDQFIGTLQYIAPEIDQGFILPNSDVWACGVTLLAMLTGRQPSSSQIRNGTFKLDTDFASLLSPHVKDLIFLMINPDPSKRPTAKEALNHPWFRYSRQQRYVDISAIQKSLQNMKLYMKYNRLQALFVSMISNYVLSQQDSLKSTEVFIECDKDNNGVISVGELKEVIASVCPKFYKQICIDNIFLEVDKNQSQSIDLREFLACSIDPEIVLQTKYIQQVFISIDSNKDNRVSVKEFKEYVNSVVPDNGVRQELFDTMDLDKDGYITLQEFIKTLKKSHA